jgi:hypothetical protein
MRKMHRLTSIIVLLVSIVIVFFLLILLLIFLRPKSKKREIYSEEQSPTVVLQNWNPEAGFHYMAGFCVLNALFTIEKSQGHNLVVLFDSGLYKEDRPEFIAENPFYSSIDWFSYYFEPINQTSKPLSYWKEFVNKNTAAIKSADLEKLQKEIIPNSVYRFDRTSIHGVDTGPDRRKTFNRLWRKYFRVRPHIKKLENDFKQKHGFSKKYVIAVHARLTDKWPSKSGTEDNPSRPPKGFWTHLIREEIAKSGRQLKDVLVFVASDEQPFVDYMKTQDFEAVSIRAIRSHVDTAGMEMDTSKCEKGILSSPECRKYNELIDASVHRGMKKKSNYAKGLDVLLAVLLLSSGDVILRSRGSVSNSAEWFSNSSTKIVDVTDVYNQR